MHAPARARHLVGKLRFARRQRIGVGHVEDADDAAQNRAARSRFKVFLMRRARLAEMHLRVDDAGQNMQAATVDRLTGRGARQIADFGDLAVAKADVARALAVLIDERAAGEDDVEDLRHEWRLACDVVAGWSFVANAPKARETQAAGGGGGRDT